MKRSLLVLFCIFAVLVLLLSWGIYATSAESVPEVTTQGHIAVDDESLKIDSNWQWRVEEIDPYKTFDDMTDRSLARDAGGNPHLAYGKNHLHYAWHDGITWHFKVVDTTDGVGGYAALALDNNDLPHISYYDYNNGDLRYAHFDGSTWLITTVDSNGDVGQYTSIAVDVNGHPHISFYDVTNTGLKYASFDGVDWVIQPLDGAGDVGQYTSLALDSSEAPHIAYYGSTHLKFAHYTGSAWQITTVDNSDLVGKYASIALDNADRAHIGYYDEANRDLKYAYFDGANWQKQAIDTEGAAGAHASLVFDSTDQPYIAYIVTDTIKTAHYNGASWQFDTLPGFASNQNAVSLGLDSTDHPAVVVAQSPHLRVFIFDGAGWKGDLVDYAGKTGGYNDIVLDEYGRPHISYCTTNSYDTFYCDYLKYATFDGLNWQIAVVDSGGYNTSLALDTAGNAHISYGAGGELRYAYFDGTSWQIESVEYTGSEWYNPQTSLALDSLGQPQISYSYYNSFGYINLKFARFDNSEWISETVDSTDTAGYESSLALDGFDHPHISYEQWNGSSDYAQLKHAYFDGVAWLTETVENGGVGTSLALDASDHPQILHFQYTGYPNGNMRFVTFDGYAWSAETALSGFNGYPHKSLVIDSLGQPHFSYGIDQWDGYKLGYAYKDNAGWHDESFDGISSYPTYSHLALDSEDKPHISYGGESLLYIHKVPVPISSVSIQGPETVAIGQPIVYTAVTLPVNAFEPITITWSNGVSGTTAVYSWSQPGMFPISTTARNPISFVTSVMTVTVVNRSYLPIINGSPKTGDLPGVVRDYDTGLGIQGAVVCVLSTGQCATTSDYFGSYDITNIPIGNHLVRASADGYITQERTVLIEYGYPSMGGAFDLIPLQRYGSVSGQVISAVTAQGIAGASVCLVSGNPCTNTDSSGNYILVNVPTGYQTVRASAGGYFALDERVEVTANQASPLNFILSPTLAQGEMRIVLTWGANPRDLDSHLWLPSSHPSHIYWAHTGNCAADPFTCLDVDDRNSYGPETITIKQRFNGTYHYAVYKYAGDGPIIASGAQVKVYDSTGLVADYAVPTSGNGDWWYVFEMAGNSGAITVHNTIAETSPGPY